MDSMNTLSLVVRGIAIVVALVFTVGGIGGFIYWKRSQLQGDN